MKMSLQVVLFCLATCLITELVGGTEGSDDSVYLYGNSGVSLGLLPSGTSHIQEPAWSRWTPLDLKVTSSPVAVSPRPGIIDIFVAGDEDALFHLRHMEIWSSSRIFGPPPTNSEPDGVSFRKYELAIAYAHGLYYLFTWGPDGCCLYKWCNEFNSSVTCGQVEWSEIDGKISSRPAAAVISDRLFLFALNESGWLIYNWADSGHIQWHGWHPLWNDLASYPSVSIGDNNSLDIFALSREGDGEVVHIVYYPDLDLASGEKIGGAILKSTPAALSSRGRLDLFGQDAGNTLAHTWNSGTFWHGWENLGGNIISPPSSVSDGIQTYVFAQGSDGRLWYAYR